MTAILTEEYHSNTRRYRFNTRRHHFKTRPLILTQNGGFLTKLFHFNKRRCHLNTRLCHFNTWWYHLTQDGIILAQDCHVVLSSWKDNMHKAYIKKKVYLCEVILYCLFQFDNQSVYQCLLADFALSRNSKLFITQTLQAFRASLQNLQPKPQAKK